jgi:hypothetical protein
MNFSRLCAGAAGLVVAAGCASYTPTIDKEDKPTGKEAYLYGRFHMNAAAHKLAIQGHQTMGFTFKCADEKSYTVKFDRDQPLQVVKISPGSCSLTEIVYSDADGFLKSRKPAPQVMQRAAVFEAGKAYYLGDFYAEGNQTSGGGRVSWNWRITNVANDYRGTTEKLRLAFPHLSTLPTENRMLGRSMQLPAK